MTALEVEAQWQPGQPRHFLGGSDASTILGISPWSSPYSLWAQLVGLYTPEHSPEMLERFQAGHDAEPFLAAVFERRTGLYVLGEQTALRHKRVPWLRGHADGFVGESPNTALTDVLGGIEFKTDSTTWQPWTDVPVHYQAQAQTYMLLSGCERWWFCVGFAGYKVETYELHADRKDQALILNAMRRFWRDHVVTGIPPEVDESDATAEALRAIYNRPEKAVVDIDGDLIADYLAAKADVDAAEARKQLAANRITAVIGNATEAQSAAGKATWRPQTTRRAAGLKEIEKRLHDVASALEVAGLITETASRVLRVTGAKEPE